ncbi:FCD domain-containing protein [Phenylobacterium sp. VNQ135]|uniref:FCD domain-containing protein n=1 Tax=Phenylobacterium sp. VNQ135 TaxID=3400922 RepID=UPI003C056E85
MSPPAARSRSGTLDVIPLASARTFAGTYDRLAEQFAVIKAAQDQHRWMFEAILARDPQRAENVMRQHIYGGRNNLRNLLEPMKQGCWPRTDAVARQLGLS